MIRSSGGEEKKIKRKKGKEKEKERNTHLLEEEDASISEAAGEHRCHGQWAVDGTLVSRWG